MVFSLDHILTDQEASTEEIEAVGAVRRFAAAVIEDACRGIGLPEPNGRTTIEAARDRLTAMGVGFVDSSAI